MNDFRTALYQKYQSTFKKHIDKIDQVPLESDYKYLTKEFV